MYRLRASDKIKRSRNAPRDSGGVASALNRLSRFETPQWRTDIAAVRFRVGGPDVFDVRMSGPCYGLTARTLTIVAVSISVVKIAALSGALGRACRVGDTTTQQRHCHEREKCEMFHTRLLMCLQDRGPSGCGMSDNDALDGPTNAL